MNKKKYSLVLGLSMLLFILSFVLLYVSFTLKETNASLFWTVLISALASFLASLVILFVNRKAIIEYEQGKRKPSKRSLKKAEKRAEKMIRKAEKSLK